MFYSQFAHEYPFTVLSKTVTNYELGFSGQLNVPQEIIQIIETLKLNCA